MQEHRKEHVQHDGGLRSHVKLIDGCGRRFALPGVGEGPDWAIPVKVFRMEGFVSKLLHCLEQTAEGMTKFRTDADGRRLLTIDPVAGFWQVDGGRRIPRCYGSLAEIANEKGEVVVEFGSTRLQEEFTQEPCRDVRETPTPRSDGDEDEFARFSLR